MKLSFLLLLPFTIEAGRRRRNTKFHCQYMNRHVVGRRDVISRNVELKDNKLTFDCWYKDERFLERRTIECRADEHGEIDEHGVGECKPNEGPVSDSDNEEIGCCVQMQWRQLELVSVYLTPVSSHLLDSRLLK